MIPGTLRSALETRLGTGVTGARALSGGCIGEVYALTLADGREAVAKIGTGPAPKLDLEGYMLRYLAEHGALPVPEVWHSAPDLLVMSLIAGSSQFNPAAESHAAELLAALHAIPGKACGLDRATLIGGLHQPNPWTDSWVAFFRDQRLLHMARAAVAEGRMDRALLARVEQLARRLDEFIGEPAHPSLLHGDVWTTNVLARGGRITGFLDPAIYYGHPEVELAFTTLFGTFHDAFFARYQELRPIPPGFFPVRRDLYNLYPLLVHVRLFGAGYLGGVDATLTRLGF